MPWQYQNGRSRTSRNRYRDDGYARQYRGRAYRNDDNDDEMPEDFEDDQYDEVPGGYRARSHPERGGNLIDVGDGQRIRVVVQSPRDMLPPIARATDYANVRRRARF